MQKTQVYFDNEAKEKLFAGLEKVFRAVSVTLGSRGRNAVYRRWGQPLITNDGVSIARQFALEDEAEAMGADLVKQSAEKTNEEAGDGTTTATILTYYLIKEGMTILKDNPTFTPMQLRREMEKALELSLEKLSKMAIPVDGDEELLKIANISSEDPKIAEIVADAVKTAGPTGMVVAEETSGFDIRKEEIEGMEVEGGFISPYFVTNPERMEAVLNSPKVLVTDMTFTLNSQIFPLMQEMAKTDDRTLVLVCKDVQGEALATLVQNKQQGKFLSVVVKAPRERDFLDDLATFCGCPVVTDDQGFKKITVNQLGRIKKLVATKEKALFVKGERNDLENSTYNTRIKSIQEEISKAEAFDKPRLNDRLARLTSSVVVIKVGAPTEAEMIYLRLKIEDAINAVRAAQKEGYVAGGGVSLRHVTRETNQELETMGSHLLALVGSKPLECLLENSGAKLEESKITAKDGYDTDSGKYVKDLIGHGIIDPVLVEKRALKNAVSLAGMFLSVNTLIVPVVEKRRMKREIVKFIKDICARYHLNAQYIPDGDIYVIHRRGKAVQNFTTAHFYQVPKRARRDMFEPLVKLGLAGNLASYTTKDQVHIPAHYGKRIV